MAKLDEEILAVEELVRSYQVLRSNERLWPSRCCRLGVICLNLAYCSGVSLR